MSRNEVYCQSPDCVTLIPMVKKILSLIIAATLLPLVAGAQESNWFRRHHVADNLDVAFTAGTTGLGLEIATPVTRWATLRAGWDGMPSFKLPLDFSITTYANGAVSNNFEKVKDMMLKLTGDEIDDVVTMNCRPTITNFKLLVDVFPFKNNRHWHFTTGFYLGGSVIGKAVSSPDETNSLVAMNLYNRIYDKMDESKGEAPIIGDIYLSPERYEELMSYGRVGIHLGDYKDGTPYYMMPKPNGTVSAKAYTNRFKPYLGFGYSGACDKAGRLRVGVEAGALFWGGAPDVITHDGVNMTKDLVNIRGRVGDYMRFLKKMVVYPGISFRISYTLF